MSRIYNKDIVTALAFPVSHLGPLREARAGMVAATDPAVAQRFDDANEDDFRTL